MTEEPPRFSDIRGGLFCDEPVSHLHSSCLSACSMA